MKTTVIKLPELTEEQKEGIEKIRVKLNQDIWTTVYVETKDIKELNGLSQVKILTAVLDGYAFGEELYMLELKHFGGTLAIDKESPDNTPELFRDGEWDTSYQTLFTLEEIDKLKAKYDYVSMFERVPYLES